MYSIHRIENEVDIWWPQSRLAGAAGVRASPLPALIHGLSKPSFVCYFLFHFILEAM